MSGPGKRRPVQGNDKIVKEYLQKFGFVAVIAMSVDLKFLIEF